MIEKRKKDNKSGVVTVSKGLDHQFSLPTKQVKTKGMFGNCFFPLFSISKNNFLFLRLKNLFSNPK